MTNLWWQKKMTKQQWRRQRRRGIIIVIFSLSLSSISCRHLVIIESLSWNLWQCHLVIDIIAILSFSLCRHRNLIIMILSSTSSCHHILCLSSCHCHLLWPLSSVFSSFFIFLFLFIGLLFLSPPSSSPSPSNTFFLHRHNFFSSCIAEIRRSFDSNGLLRSEFALISYFNKLITSADWLAGLAEERAALGWRVF